LPDSRVTFHEGKDALMEILGYEENSEEWLLRGNETSL
jgi:hypothetical protein